VQCGNFEVSGNNSHKAKPKINIIYMSNTQINKELIISSVRALWDMITPSLRSVSVELRDNKIIWQCIFDEDGTEDDFELMSSAAGELIADYSNYGLEEIIKKIPKNVKVQNLENLIYSRHESNNNKEE
jgi:hypothetical protein